MSAATDINELLDRVGVTAGDVEDLVHDLRQAMSASVEQIVARVAAGEDVFPVIEMDDVLAGTVSADRIGAIHATGCAVVRGTFERSQAEQWDAELADYVSGNRFRERLFEKYPDAVGGSGIWPVYWSPSQIAARQHERMTAVRMFLNGLWSSESDGVRWFEADRDIGYPDRVRRRQPGAVAKGLKPHIDAPSAGGWRLPENQDVFAPLLSGGLEAYDPWDAAHRTGIDVESPVNCTVFRTFQGWTAMSEMHPDDGVLQVVPIPAGVGYRLVEGIAGELGLFGEPVPAPRRDACDDLLAQALVAIPAVEPGDTVWWHGDLFHAVGEAANDTRWGNVMYIGAAPRCPRNDAYATTTYERFLAGLSPIDFPYDDFEADFAGRAGPDDLNATGRDQFGLVARA